MGRMGERFEGRTGTEDCGGGLRVGPIRGHFGTLLVLYG